MPTLPLGIGKSDGGYEVSAYDAWLLRGYDNGHDDVHFAAYQYADGHENHRADKYF